jgi:hypothetical protein
MKNWKYIEGAQTGNKNQDWDVGNIDWDVGNFKTGTSQLKPGDKVMSFGKKGTVKEVIGENTDNIYGEPLIKVEFEDGTTKTIGEHYMRKVGNTKTGNRVIEKESEMSQELKNLLKKAPEWIKEKIQYAFSHGFTIDEKDFINAIKKEVGNSASDDKFAYVMREFDEGKLKTPDGKVVTDPAQAKAIAYSESKKTENGLARARKAMNKKCGNSQVTLWKGNDSVLISEDGTVQYLESNSFETDRDKYGSMQEAIDDLTKKGYRKK